MARRHQKTTVIALVLILTVAVFTLWMFRCPLLEDWYLCRLNSKDPAVRQNAVDRLDALGSMKAAPQRAFEVSRRIKSAEDDGWLLADVAILLESVGDNERSTQALKETASKPIIEESTRCGFAFVRAQRGDVNSALEVLAPSDKSSSPVVLLYIELLVLAGQVDSALDIARNPRMAKITQREALLMQIARALAFRGDVTRALVVTEEINDQLEIRSSVRSEIATDLAAKGRLSDARTIVHRIERDEWRARPLAALARSTVEAGDRDSARELVGMAIDAAGRSHNGAATIALAQLDLADLAAAEKAAQRIDERKLRARILVHIAKAQDARADKRGARRSLALAKAIVARKFDEELARRIACVEVTVEGLDETLQRARAEALPSRRDNVLKGIIDALLQRAEISTARALLEEVSPAPSTRGQLIRDVARAMVVRGLEAEVTTFLREQKLPWCKVEVLIGISEAIYGFRVERFYWSTIRPKEPV